MHESDLTAIALKLADGTPIDWQALKSEAPDAYTRLINRFQEIEALSRAHVGIGPPSAQEFESIRKGLSVDEGAPVRWGHLEILDKVGRGSYGDVYRARDSRLDRIVALKLLRRSDGNDDAASESEIIEEARLIARVRHPNVVTVHGAERIDGRTGVWMEFVEGRTLQEIVSATGPLRRDEVRRIGIQLCRALAAVHACGLLHRDVKAQNVMLSTDGRVLLMDFSAVVDHEKGQGTYPLAGTPLYAAPEILSGKPASIRSDLYGLAVLLHYIGTGTFPVNGESIEAIRAAHLLRAGVSRSMTQRLGPALATTISRALDSDPSRRFEDAVAFEQALFRSAPWHWPRLRMWPGVLAAMLVLALVGLVWAGRSAVLWQRLKPTYEISETQLHREQELREVLEQFEPFARYRYLELGPGSHTPSDEDISALESEADRAAPGDTSALNRLLIAMWQRFGNQPRLPARTPVSLGAIRSLAAKRRQRILWLIRHHPEAELAGSVQASLFPVSLSEWFPADAEGYLEAKRSWLDATNRADVSSSTLDHAAAFFEITEPFVAERLLLRALAADRSTVFSVRLGVLYAEAITNSTRWPMGRTEVLPDRDKFSPSSPRANGIDTAFAQVAQAKLAESKDPILLIAAGNTILRPNPLHRTKLPNIARWAQDCYERAVLIAPDSVTGRSALVAVIDQVRRGEHGGRLLSVPRDKQLVFVMERPENEQLGWLTDLALESFEDLEGLDRSRDQNLRGRAEVDRQNVTSAVQELLRRTDKRLANTDHGRARYVADMVLGSLALRDGDTRAAVRYLQAAGHAPRSEWLTYSTSIIGERRTLSRGALELPSKLYLAGQGAAVADFCDQMARVNLAMRLELRDAAARLRRGGSFPMFQPGFPWKLM